MKTSLTSTPFSNLSIDRVMNAVETQGYHTDSRILAMNSYENRVYKVGVDDAESIIVKFYRPHRWSIAQIQEEHYFCYELSAEELPVVCPLQNSQGESIFSDGELYFSLYPCQGGREPDLEQEANLITLGRVIGKMHAVAKVSSFKTRPNLSIATFAEDSITEVLQTIPEDLKPAYHSVCKQLVEKLQIIFAQQQSVEWIRCHGDTHRGNILWRDSAPHFIDFDDARLAPAIQDLWMFLAGDSSMQAHQIDLLLSGYTTFCEFNYQEIRLIEPLRTLRMMYYAAWLSKRKLDPAFIQHFPWFNTPRYWGEHIDELKIQLSNLAAL